MASILDALSAYGTACRCNYPQGDDVEDAMNYICEFAKEHGYNFPKADLERLRIRLGLCPIKDKFRGNGICCKDCEYSIEKGDYYIYYKCKLIVNG